MVRQPGYLLFGIVLSGLAFYLYSTGTSLWWVGAAAFLALGAFNNAFGKDAGRAISSGGYNTVLGHGAGESIASGSYNICVGQGADAAHDSARSITIGTGITGQGDKFKFGKASNIVYNSFTSNASWTRSSDERKKTNIADATLGLDFINDLRPVTFKWKASKDIPNTLDDYDADVNHMDTDVTMHGMVAQDVKAALDTAGVTTFGGWAEEVDGSQSLSQEMFVHPLIKAVQELSTKNDSLETSNTALAARITALENA